MQGLLGTNGAQMLNKIWGVTQKPKSGVVALIRSWFLNFSMIGVIIFLLLVSLAASTVISGMGTYFGNILPLPSGILEIFNFIISFIVITALLFTIGKTVISIYIGNSSVSSGYGAAGSLVVLLLWVYYSAQILF